MARQLWRLALKIIKTVLLVSVVIVIPTMCLVLLLALMTPETKGLQPFESLLWMPTVLAMTLLSYYFYKGLRDSREQH